MAPATTKCASPRISSSLSWTGWGHCATSPIRSRPARTSARRTTTRRAAWPLRGPSWSGCRTCWPRRRIWRTLSPSNPPSPTRSWRSSG
ncbi:Helix-turn-helix domain-containing protein, partial [Dysosmobacter welbionis]